MQKVLLQPDIAYRIPRYIGSLESVFRVVVNGSRCGVPTISWQHQLFE